MATAIAELPTPAFAERRYRSLFGWLAEFRRDALGFLERCRDAGDVLSFRARPVTGFVLSHPDGVRQVLERDREHYWKGSVFGRIARHVGSGILFQEGERWRAGRRLLQPAFSRERLRAMGQEMGVATEAWVERWERAERSRPGEPVELQREGSSYALDVAGRTLFGEEFGERLGSYSDLVTELLEYSNYLINSAAPLPWWLPTARNRRFWPVRGRLQSDMDALIEARRRSGSRRDDLLQLLLDAEADPEEDYVSGHQVRDECSTFLGAGHETTGVCLAWTGYLLARNPEVQERLHAEAVSAIAGRVPTLDELDALPFTRRVIQESLRLYPPAWGIGREAYGGSELGGRPVPKGAAVFVSPWAMHRDPRFWEAPERFDPDRFLPERSAGRPRYAWFPFGGGARRCIGDAFALQELAMAIGALVKSFRLVPVPGQTITPYPVFTLRPSPGVLVTHPLRGA